MELQQATYETGGNMSEAGMNLGDIPDLSGIDDGQSTAWENGWYEGVIIGRREFTDKNGNDRVFESSDTLSKNGNGRNIRLQVQLKRQDGREMNLSDTIYYTPDDLTQETIQKVMAQKEKIKNGEQWGSLFRPYMTLNRLGTLQKIAGVRQLQRDTDGSLNLTPLFGKTAYFKLKDDENGKYKEIDRFRETRPTKVPVL